MGPMLSLASALLLSGTPVGPCYVPSDQTAGWKRVALPEDTPALSAPADLEQFRAGEPVLYTEQNPANTYLGATERRFGRMAYTFRVPKGTSRLEVEFLDSLNGAKVDATAYLGSYAYPLLSERRQHGGQLQLEWTGSDIDTVVVEVHHHLRERPVVRHWRVGRQVWLAQEPATPEAFHQERSLYYRHPGGRRIELCDTPRQPLRLSRWPEGAPADVTLTRARPVGQ